MSNWIASNLSTISGIAIAFLTAFSSLLGFLRERSLDGKYIKKVKQYAEIYKLLPDESKAKPEIDELLAQMTRKLHELENRKMNGTNIVLIVFVAGLGGGLSYLLALWAMQVSGFWSIPIWVLFGISMFFTIGLSITGWAKRYSQSK